MSSRPRSCGAYPKVRRAFFYKENSFITTITLWFLRDASLVRPQGCNAFKYKPVGSPKKTTTRTTTSWATRLICIEGSCDSRRREQHRSTGNDFTCDGAITRRRQQFSAHPSAAGHSDMLFLATQLFLLFLLLLPVIFKIHQIAYDISPRFFFLLLFLGGLSLWLVALFQAASIMQGSNGLQPPLNAIKIEAPSYYCNSYTPPAPDHSAMLQAGAYSTSQIIY